MKHTGTILALLAVATVALPTAYASEVTGTLTTGVSTGVTGTFAPTPSATPLPGTYSSAQDVVLSADGEDVIRYTTDGSAPTCSFGTVFSGHVDVDSSVTIRAIACYAGVASQVGTFAYGINLPAAPSGGGGGGGGGGTVTPPPATSDATPGDVNGDDTVDIIDFNSIVVDWGATGSSLASDLNRDGVVDVLDFNLIIVNWTT